MLFEATKLISDKDGNKIPVSRIKVPNVISLYV